MILSEDERRAFDLYFAHAYQATINKQALERSGQQRPLATMQVDTVSMAADIAMEMLQARRERLGD